MLEKAYAKLNRCYEGLDGGNTAEALVDFTSGICEVVNCRTRDPKEDEKLFKALLKAHERGAMMSCSIDAGRGDMEKSAGMGLIKGHAYSINQVVTVHTPGLPGLRDSYELMQLRNPWGEREWTGAWSDGSKEWEAIKNKDKKKYGVVDNKDDGSFFMDYKDVLKHFSQIIVCRIVNTSFISIHKTWTLATFRGSWQKSGAAWSGSSAGGCVNNKVRLARMCVLISPLGAIRARCEQWWCLRSARSLL